MTISQPSNSGTLGAVRAWFIKNAIRGPQGESREPISQPTLLRSATEILIIAIWACWVGRAFLDFNPYTWPLGREFGYQIEGHLFWNQVKSCGLCGVWNGGINGGAPALADLFSSKLHPFVAIPTLIWGVTIGVKVSIVLSFWTAGVAQWWLAKILRLSWIARLWGALLAVVGGHLLGRLELGSPGLVLSTAASSLALVAAIDLAISGSRNSTIRLGVFGGLAILSGAGYLQLGLLAWAPALLFLVMDEGFRLRPVWKEYALAALLALLLAGLAIVPAIRFFPNFEKFTDATFQASQPLEYIPLNLVIRDHVFFRNDALGKFPFEYLYILYIGWVPVILAVISLRNWPRAKDSILLCLVSGAILMFFFASGIPMLWLVKLIPSLAGFRHTPLIAGMAIPAILGMASVGLESVLSSKWPEITIRVNAIPTGGGRSISLAWLMVFPLFWSLHSAYDFGRIFLTTTNVEPLYDSVSAMKTPNLAWVSTPYGEHFWVEPALEEGLKLTSVVTVWQWRGRGLPSPRLLASRDTVPPDGIQVGLLQDTIPIYEVPGLDYAYVETDSGMVPCLSSGSGGNLTVECSSTAGGRLIVQENSWNGWRAYVDQEPAELHSGPLLSTDALPGKHTYQFVYRPWDVIVGMLLTIAGVGLALALGIESELSRSGSMGVPAGEVGRTDPPL